MDEGVYNEYLKFIDNYFSFHISSFLLICLVVASLFWRRFHWDLEKLYWGFAKR